MDRDPQYNLRELQLHYQYMGLLPGTVLCTSIYPTIPINLPSLSLTLIPTPTLPPASCLLPVSGILAEAYSLCLLHLYPSLGKYIPPPPPSPPLPPTAAASSSAEPTLSTDEKKEEKKKGEEMERRPLPSEQRHSKSTGSDNSDIGVNNASGRGARTARARIRTVRLGIVSEHEGNSSPGA